MRTVRFGGIDLPVDPPLPTPAERSNLQAAVFEFVFSSDRREKSAKTAGQPVTPEASADEYVRVFSMALPNAGVDWATLIEKSTFLERLDLMFSLCEVYSPDGFTRPPDWDRVG